MHIGLTLTLAALMTALAWQQCAPGGAHRLAHSLVCSTQLAPRLATRLGLPADAWRCSTALGPKQQRLRPQQRIHAGGQHTGDEDPHQQQPQQPQQPEPGQHRPQPQQPQQQKQKSKPGPIQSFFAQLVLLLRVLGTLALLAAAAPYLLSTRLGTAAVAAAASRMLPGDVHIQRVSLGWAQPVAVTGLSIFEGAAGASRRLIGVQRFSSAEPLHQVVTGKANHLTLTLTNPSIDCSLTDCGDNFRLVRYLEQSRLLGILTGRHSTAAAAAGSGPAAAAAAAAVVQQGGGSARQQQEGATAGAKAVPSHPIDVSDAADVDDTLPSAGMAAAAAPVAGGTATQQASAAAAAAAEATSSGSSSAAAGSSRKGEQQQQPKAAAAVAAAAAAASPALPANFIQRLAQADASSHVSAELRLPMLSVYIPDGQLLLPQEMAAAMGSHIHAVAAAGGTAVTDLAEELEEDCSWLDAQQQHPQQQQQQQSQKQDQQQQEGMVDALHQRWPLPPASISRKDWAHATPIMLQVSGERVSGLVRGWHMGSVWRFSQSSLLLQQPATATWEFTPELAALTLSQFNPLLEEVALIREGGQLTTAIAPAEGRLPAETGQLWVSPVKLVVGKGNLLSQIYRLLGLHGRFGSHTHSSSSSSGHKQPWLSGSSSGATTAAAAAKEAAAAAAEDGSSVRGVEVWSGPLRVVMEAPGRFRTERVDMMLGSGRNSLHLALWGTVDTTTNTLDMTVGLPASTLAKAGLGGLPAGYLLPVAVSGPLHRPQVEWNAAVRQLAVLSAMQLGREAWQYEGERVVGALWGAATHEQAGAGVPAGIAGLFGAANRALSKATSSFIGQVDERLQNALQNVPPPADLPWDDAHVGEDAAQGSRRPQHGHKKQHRERQHKS